MLNHLKSSMSIVALLIVGGCASSSQHVSQVGQLQSIVENPRVLLIQPDVKFFRNTAGGLLEPQAEWTEAARTNIAEAIDTYGKDRHLDFVEIGTSTATDDLELAYERLHEAVGSAVLTHYFQGGLTLPSKAGRFDWSLGPGISNLCEKYSADYVLFTYYRDIEATGGRWAMSIISTIVTGVAMAAEAQFGFASLVDAHSGAIVWFNRVQVGTGDLRERTGATRVVEQLFESMPSS